MFHLGIRCRDRLRLDGWIVFGGVRGCGVAQRLQACGRVGLALKVVCGWSFPFVFSWCLFLGLDVSGYLGLQTTRLQFLIVGSAILGPIDQERARKFEGLGVSAWQPWEGSLGSWRYCRELCPGPQVYT